MMRALLVLLFGILFVLSASCSSDVRASQLVYDKDSCAPINFFSASCCVQSGGSSLSQPSGSIKAFLEDPEYFIADASYYLWNRFSFVSKMMRNQLVWLSFVSCVILLALRDEYKKKLHYMEALLKVSSKGGSALDLTSGNRPGTPGHPRIPRSYSATPGIFTCVKMLIRPILPILCGILLQHLVIQCAVAMIPSKDVGEEMSNAACVYNLVIPFRALFPYMVAMRFSGDMWEECPKNSLYAFIACGLLFHVCRRGFRNLIISESTIALIVAAYLLTIAHAYVGHLRLWNHVIWFTVAFSLFLVYDELRGGFRGMEHFPSQLVDYFQSDFMFSVSLGLIFGWSSLAKYFGPKPSATAINGLEAIDQSVLYPFFMEFVKIVSRSF